MEREKFGSRIGMLLTMAGSAVGLGNIWRFPYLVGENGGAAFIILYLLFVVFLSIPILLCEFAIGRRSRSNARSAFKKLAPGRFWGITGVFIILIPAMILSYYDVVGGWSIEYFFKSCTLDFTSGEVGLEELGAFFDDYSSSVWAPIVSMMVFIAVSALVVAFGVKGGIERFGKVVMPVLFIVVILIAVWVATLPGAEKGFAYLFRPDFSKVTADTCLAALGQAFFSLTLGCGAMLTFASYTEDNENLLSSAVQIAILDLLFAIIASCAVVPAAFAYGIDPGQGSGLLFKTLPFIFSQMPLGAAVAIFFFGAVLIAAITSSVSLYEVVTAWLVEDHGFSRASSVAVIFIVMVVTGVLCSLSFGVLSGFRICGFNIFDGFDFLSADVLMPLGSLMICLFVGWRMPRPDFFGQFTNNGSLRVNKILYPAIYALIRYVAPVGIAVIFVAGLV